jgi:hypothetical protein
MATYTPQQLYLMRDAENYTRLGYKVGYCKGKELIEQHYSAEDTFGSRGLVYDKRFDGISIIPEDLACVDIDVPDFGVVYEHLPPTWKEKTPRGYHLWYSVPRGASANTMTPKIKWRPHVDLLIKGRHSPAASSSQKMKSSRYDDEDEDGVPNPNPKVWGEHVLCSGTPGYKRIWPDEMPAKSKLTIAPLWLQDALLKD